MNSFMNYLKKNYRGLYNQFAPTKTGSSAFDKRWKSLAASNPQFAQAQHNFIKSSHYDPARSKVFSSTGVDINKRSKAVQDVLWSTAVQHGSAGAKNVFKSAGVSNRMSDRQIINAVYAERSKNNGSKYFGKSSSSVRKSVVNRFAQEKRDALRMLA